MNTHFSPNAQNVKTRLSKLLHYDQILPNDRDHQVLIVACPNMRPANPRWRTAANLKTVKSPYIRNRLANLTKFGICN